jgi:hypothetical protein
MYWNKYRKAGAVTFAIALIAFAVMAYNLYILSKYEGLYNKSVELHQSIDKPLPPELAQERKEFHEYRNEIFYIAGVVAAVFLVATGVYAWKAKKHEDYDPLGILD